METDAAHKPSNSENPAASGAIPPAPSRPRRLSEEFALILREFDVETVTLREVTELLHGRGFVLLVMLLALPFCTPIPLPGLSTPLGAIILLIGVRLMLGAKPWLPSRLLDTRLPPKVFAKVFAFTRRILVAFERLLRPRLPWLTETAWMRQLHAVPIVLCALLLLLPLPVPFSNILPALGIMLIAAGLLECDGGFIAVGWAVTVVAVAFFTAIGIAGVEALDFLWKWAAQ